jgi:transcription-repair coupling factor (superfamily II helicase)
MKARFEAFPLALLGRVAKALEHNPSPVRITGVHSCAALGAYLSHVQDGGRVGQHPLLVVTPGLDEAQELIDSLAFFAPHMKASLLPAFDVGVYSNLYPNQRVIAQRLNWLFRATQALPGEIFVAPVEALMQKTLPYSEFSKHVMILKKNTELPSRLSSWLTDLGYSAAPTVEDIGTYSLRGGILDIFSPGQPYPVRLELFGDLVESVRSFDPATQLTLQEEPSATILPAREVLYSDENRQLVSRHVKAAANERPVSQDDLQDILRSISQGQPFYGIDFLLPYFYDKLISPIEYFSTEIDYWVYDRLEVVRKSDQLLQTLKTEFASAVSQTLRINYQDLYFGFEDLLPPENSQTIWVDTIEVLEAEARAKSHSIEEDATLSTTELKSTSLRDFITGIQTIAHDNEKLTSYIQERFGRWRSQGYRIIVATSSQSLGQKVQLLLERSGFSVRIIESPDVSWPEIMADQNQNLSRVHIVLRDAPVGFRFTEEHVVFIRDQDLLGRRRASKSASSDLSALERSEALSFGELQAGDFVVHRVHGVGIYEGLKAMSIDGAPAEFLELKYKDADRLYLPVYRLSQLHKYSGPTSAHMVDKLGGPGWAKTKTKVRNLLRDVADKLLRLYAKRAQLSRPAFSAPGESYFQFEGGFPYQETDDQLRAIEDVLRDLNSTKPMDRLVCGDVGFGKTEVALRAAFKAVEDHKQVAVIAPTTILSHQHFETFKRRFAKWPVTIRVLNRFVSPKEVKQTLQEVRAGQVDILIGTHRLLSKDIEFKNLGLLVIDEEQKFGVVHKERLRHLREGVDTLTLSATPIPRTLNMSLVGIRDLSLINTPPEDRLPTRTFICKFDEETLRKAIRGEIERGGQVFFLHNRVQTIDETAARIRSIVPDARIAIAHGQMEEHQLEAAMLKFFNHEVDILVCTAIIESGMDIPRANTIFIDNAHTFGVSQLYQLRGRVGRSKERAYCYLILPSEKRVDATAQERLKVIQENTALGSGLRVAQYDLELRGAGDILGEDQSGHINAVGYELYMELLDEVIHEQRGDSIADRDIEPEINLRVPALLPDKYMPDIRMRLYYYKSLSNVRSIEDIDRIEQELRDQFGPPPEPVMNLLGLMLIRKYCRDLGVKDVSAGKSAISLAFTAQTALPPVEVVRLTTKENKKFSLAPDQRLKIRMNEITWMRVVEELEFLLKLCPTKTQG